VTPERRENRATTCQDIIVMADEKKKKINKIITGDETWCFAYYLETK
jgi:hypothetical protein